ncbi:MAG: type II secretion system F family protein, partial [Chloroflexi bacterium]|nr:type II secretion system F family protein [Chloroflexota bacterium]
LVGFTLPFAAFVLYPQARAWERKGRIDGNLPYAIGWMSTMVSVGVIPYITFKKLAEAKEYFGEVSNEASLVVRDVEVLGFDFISALRNLVVTTPSTHLRVFVQGAVTNALSGGEMGEYFVSKARETSADNQRKFGQFIEGLGLISELYITMMVAAPLFMIVLYSAMMMLRGASPMVLMAIIYLFLPLGTMVFLLMTDMLTPQGKK